MRYLLYHKDGLIKKFPLQKPVIRIGRSISNDIIIDDKGVSKKHCKVEVFDDCIKVTDLSSLNGTFVDNTSVKEARITLNRSFGVLNTDFFFKLGDIKEFKINKDLSNIIVGLAKRKRSAKQLELETKECETKYDRLLQNVVEKAMSFERLPDFIGAVKSAISPIIRKGSLFFIHHNQWFTLFDHRPLNDPAALKKQPENFVDKEGSFVLKGETCYYRLYKCKTDPVDCYLIFVNSQNSPAPRDPLHKFLTKLIEIIEFNLQIVPDISFKIEPEPILFQNRDISILGSSPAIKKMVELAQKIAAKSTFILIMGESGTGKELIAKMLHHLSERKKYMAFNCAAIPANLLESELFGYESGAFTDARKQKKGRIEEASGGTLVLDEISDMSLEIQAKLLRVIQEKSLMRLGGLEEIKVDLRIISMTNQDIYRLVKEKKFREDLFFRLRVHELHVPPLRERREDIPGLIKFFSRVYSDKNGIIPGGFSESFGECLFNYDWPGNIRELENEISRIMEIIEDHELISDHHVLPAITAACEEKEERAKTRDMSPIKEEMRNIEREKILSLLDQNKGNKTKTAKMIGMSYRGFLKKLKRLQID